MRNAWLTYLGAVWRTSPPDTLVRIKGAPEAKELLDRLNATLYADSLHQRHRRPNLAAPNPAH